MSRTRYCSSCGALLDERAVICGECGARYQESPYERRATDAPVAWARQPLSRARVVGERGAREEPDDGIELITADAVIPRDPGATALRPAEQYDRMMVTQPAMPQSAPAAPTGRPSGPGAPAPSYGAPGGGTSPTGELAAPLDGCVPASPTRRLAAGLIDGAISGTLALPLLIGLVLLTTQDPSSMPAAILVGVGVALPGACALVTIWLTGSAGFSLGKLALGLRITHRRDGGGIGFLRALARWALYGVFTGLIALTIFLDPQKQLRGLHDRAVGSVVVDIRSGRHPMTSRADDFERPVDGTYLGAPSVAVSTHDSLLTEPGAVWHDSTVRHPGHPQRDERALPAVSDQWGRPPATTAGPSERSDAEPEEAVVRHDEGRSMPTMPTRIEGPGEDMLVTDLGATHGSRILGVGGSPGGPAPQAFAVVPSGTTLTLGDRTLTVEKNQ